MTDNVTPSPSLDSTQRIAGDEHEIVRDLHARFGTDGFVFQAILDDMPTLWVPRSKLIDVLSFLRQVPRPYVMLYDLSATDERLRQNRLGMPSTDYTVFYHLLSIERNSDIRIKVALDESDLNLPTCIGIWPNANTRRQI